LASGSTSVLTSGLTLALALVSAGSGYRCRAKLDRDKPLAHCDGAGPGRGQFSFVATTDPPSLSFEPTCDGRLPLEAGAFRYSPATRILSGRVRLWNRTSRPLEHQVAFVDFLADDNGDKRFEPQLSTAVSVVTPAGRRGFRHGRVKARHGTWARWAFAVPRGAGRLLRGSGWIDAAPQTALWVELEELAASRAEGRRGPGGWQWLHRWADYSGWGVLHVSRVRHRRALSRELRLPTSGRYRVLLVGGRQQPRGVELRLGGLTAQVGDARRLGRGLYELGTVELGRRAALSLRHTRKRGVTLDALVLVPQAEDSPARVALPRALPPLVLGGRQMARELLGRYLRQRLKRSPRPAAVTSSEEWKRRAPAIRAALRHTLDLPPHRPDAPPPRVLHLGTVKQGKLVVEKLFIEGTSGLWASALLYRPAGATGRLPAVLHALGHYGRGKHYRPALIFDTNLAARGFVVLAVDALGLGERVVGKEDHHFHGLLHWLVGGSTTREMVGEKIRFVDYLRSRKDVDPQRIGMAGSSGGGTLTLYTTAVDTRIAAASSMAAVADWEWLFRFIGGDPEMYPWDVVRIADYATLLRLAAPRPMLVSVGRKDDMFPPRPARRVVRRARDAYRAFPDRLELFVDRYPHGLKPGRRRATYRFFQKHLQEPLASSTPVGPEDISLALFPVTTGRPPVTRSLVDGARQPARNLPPPLSPGGSRREAQAAIAHRRRALARTLAHRLPPIRSSTDWIQRGWLAGSSRFKKVVLRPERGVRLPGLLLEPPGPARAAIVYVSDAGRFSAVHAVTLSEAGYLVLVVDLLGLGETTPNRRYRYGLGRPGALFMQDFFGAAFLHILGDSLYAMRVHHLRWVAQHLAARRRLPVGVLGQGTECGVYALTAAALEPTLAGAAALGSLRSFKLEILKARFPAPGLVAHGILKVADIPQLVALTAPRPVLVIGGRASDGTREQIAPRADFMVPRAFYKVLGHPDRLLVKTALSSPRKLLLDWARRLSAQPPRPAAN
jgi:dienelactone hydrolase